MAEPHPIGLTSTKPSTTTHYQTPFASKGSVCWSLLGSGAVSSARTADLPAARSTSNGDAPVALYGTSLKRSREHTAHLLAVVVPTTLLRLVAEGPLINADVAVVADVVLHDVIELDAVGWPCKIRLRGLRLKENSHDLRIIPSPKQCSVEGRPAPRVVRVNIDPRVDQNPHDLRVASENGFVQNRIVVRGPRVNVSAPGDECPDLFGLAPPYG